MVSSEQILYEASVVATRKRLNMSVCYGDPKDFKGNEKIQWPKVMDVYISFDKSLKAICEKIRTKEHWKEWGLWKKPNQRKIEV